MRESGTRLDAWIVSAAGGDRGAMESLLLHFHDPLLQFIGRSVCRGRASEIAAEDVLQETLIEAFRQIRKVEPRGKEAFFAWLKTIARTRHINLMKAHRALKRGGGRPAANSARDADATASSILNLLAGREPTPSRVLRRKEAIDALKHALSQLEPERRQLVELRYGSGLPVEQIACRTGKSVGAVKMLIHRAVRELREFFDGQSGDFSVGA